MTALQQERHQQAARIAAGWQCPECYGVQIERTEDRFHIRPDRFECRECGCTWHRSTAT